MAASTASDKVLDPGQLGLVLDNSSFVPYYEQIVQQIRNLVKTEKLAEGQTFCSEGDVASLLGISKMPVRQAFQKLRSEGLLIIEKGKKPVIGSARVPWNFQQLRGFSEEMRRRGLVPSAKVLDLKLMPCENEAAQALKLTVGEQVWCLERLRYVNGEPVALVKSYLPARIFRDLDKQDLNNQSLYQVYETRYGYKLHWAEEVIGAIEAGEEDSRILETKPGKALLLIRETTYDVNRTAIEYSRSRLRADRYTAMVISIRKRT